eukprot:m.172554 g.172554  ORF g.172554 m.172554 type:complete len:328 (+) comp16720_c0_seq1:1295-2278(+)
MTLAMGQSTGTNYLTLLVYGYMTGDFLVPSHQVLPVRESTNTRATKRRVSISSFEGYSPYLLYSIGVLFTSISTYDSNQGIDHFSMAAGRSYTVPEYNWRNDPFTESAEYYGDVLISHEGESSTSKDYYGKSHGSSMIPTLSGMATYDTLTGIGLNTNSRAYTRNSIWGLAPSDPSLTNIRYLSINKACRIKLSSRRAADVRTNITAPDLCGIPSDATALISTIHTYNNGSNYNQVVHSFGRNAAHSQAPVNNAPYTLPDSQAWLNDVLITHEGDGTYYFYGHFHGTQLIPLKSGAKFDAMLNAGGSTASDADLQAVTILVVGYIAK